MRPHNLPTPLTRFIGWERETPAVAALLQAKRLVTLTGPGGHGKTRPAVEVGRQVLPNFAQGVWLVELAALQDPTLVPAAIVGVLGVREEAGRPPLESLRQYCRDRCTLLVLDNCEHLVSVVADVAWELLQSAPQLRIRSMGRPSCS